MRRKVSDTVVFAVLLISMALPAVEAQPALGCGCCMNLREAVGVSVQPCGNVTINGDFNYVNVSFIDTSQWCFDSLTEMELLVSRNSFSTREVDVLRQLPYTATLRTVYNGNVGHGLNRLKSYELAELMALIFNMNLTLSSWDINERSFNWIGNASFVNVTAAWRRIMKPYSGLAELFTGTYLNYSAPNVIVKLSLKEESNYLVWRTALLITERRFQGAGDHVFSLNNLFQRQGIIHASVKALSSWVNISLPTAIYDSKPVGMLTDNKYAINLRMPQILVDDILLYYRFDFPLLTRLPELNVSKMSAQSVETWESFTVVVSIANLGNDSAYHIRIYDTLPKGINLVRGKLDSSIFRLRPGEMTVLTYVVNASAAGEYKFPQANVTCITFEGYGSGSASNKIMVTVRLPLIFVIGGVIVCAVMVAVLYRIGLVKRPSRR